MPELHGTRNGWAVEERNTQPVFCRDVPRRKSFPVSLTLCNTASISAKTSQKHFNMFTPYVGCFICHMTNGLLNHPAK